MSTKWVVTATVKTYRNSPNENISSPGFKFYYLFISAGITVNRMTTHPLNWNTLVPLQTILWTSLWSQLLLPRLLCVPPAISPCRPATITVVLKRLKCLCSCYSPRLNLHVNLWPSTCNWYKQNPLKEIIQLTHMCSKSFVFFFFNFL